MKRTQLPILLLLLVAAAILAATVKKEKAKQPAAVTAVSTSTPQPATPPVSAPAPSANANPVFAKLQGKWMRSDGDYTIEIKSVGPSGAMDAGYFNPQPIHVAKAQATQEGGVAKVFIELRDVNYPGSSYTLLYAAANDQLKGTYFQAVSQESYDIYFERVK
ncbi:MAG: hypothetical protein WCH57_00495 [Verrucomicrobiota bacterium]